MQTLQEIFKIAFGMVIRRTRALGFGGIGKCNSLVFARQRVTFQVTLNVHFVHFEQCKFVVISFDVRMNLF